MMSLAACVTGFFLDRLFGDPVWLYHPVRMIGNMISFLEKRLRKENDKKNILFDSILHRIRYAVSLQGEELLEWFDNNFYYQCLIPESVKKEDMNRSKEEYNESIVINNQMIGAEKGSIKDVYEVSLFLEKFFAKENRNGESV